MYAAAIEAAFVTTSLSFLRLALSFPFDVPFSFPEPFFLNFSLLLLPRYAEASRSATLGVFGRFFAVDLFP